MFLNIILVIKPDINLLIQRLISNLNRNYEKYFSFLLLHLLGGE